MKYLTTLVIALTLALWPATILLPGTYRALPLALQNLKPTIFSIDPPTISTLNFKRSLYGNDFLGRFFNNKATVIWQRFQANFLAQIDPNNYFFGFHPREIVGGENFDKFPFVAIIFFFYGLYRGSQKKWGQALLCLFMILVGFFSLADFNKVDFLLYPILSAFIVFGIISLEHQRPKLYLFTAVTLVAFSIPQYFHTVANLLQP